MPFIAWNDRLSVSVAAIDEDHRMLVGMLNELYDGILAGRGNDDLDEILNGLMQYTRTHFAREESFAEQTGFPQLAQHKSEHNEMSAWVAEMRAGCADGSAKAPSLQVVNFLKDWLFDHILQSDKKLGIYLASMGIH